MTTLTSPRNRKHQRARWIVTNLSDRFAYEQGYQALLHLPNEYARQRNWCLAENVSLIVIDYENQLDFGNEDFVHVCNENSGAVIVNVRARFVRPIVRDDSGEESEESSSVESSSEADTEQYETDDIVNVAEHNEPGKPWRPQGTARIINVNSGYADIRYIISRRRESVSTSFFTKLVTEPSERDTVPSSPSSHGSVSDSNENVSDSNESVVYGTPIETTPEETTPAPTTPEQTTPVQTTPAPTTPAPTTPGPNTPIDVTEHPMPVEVFLPPGANSELITLIQTVIPVPTSIVFTEKESECVRHLLDKRQMLSESVVENSLDYLPGIWLVDSTEARQPSQTPKKFVRSILRKRLTHKVTNVFVIFYESDHFTCMDVNFETKTVTYFDMWGTLTIVRDRLKQSFPGIASAFRTRGYTFNVSPPTIQQTGVECGALVVLRYYNLYLDMRNELRGMEARIQCLHHLISVKRGVEPSPLTSAPASSSKSAHASPPASPPASSSTSTPASSSKSTPASSSKSTPRRRRKRGRRRRSPDVFVSYSENGTAYGTPGPTGTVNKKRKFNAPRRT